MIPPIAHGTTIMSASTVATQNRQTRQPREPAASSKNCRRVFSSYTSSCGKA